MANKPFDIRQFVKDITTDIPVAPRTPGAPKQTFPSPGRSRIAAQRGADLRAAVEQVMKAKNLSRSAAIGVLMDIAQKAAAKPASSTSKSPGTSPARQAGRVVGGVSRNVGAVILGPAAPFVPGFKNTQVSRARRAVSGAIRTTAGRLPKPPSARKTAGALKEFGAGLFGR